MSKFRVELDCAFNEENDAVSFLNFLRDIQVKLFPGTGSEEIAIITKCRYHECFHDETPPKPCGGYIDFDLSKPIVDAVKTKEGVEVDSLAIVSEKVDAIKAEAIESAKPIEPIEPIVEGDGL